MVAPAALVLWETGRRTEPGLQAPWHIVAWYGGSHQGVPLIASDRAVNVIGRSGDYLLAGFPGQSRVSSPTSIWAATAIMIRLTGAMSWPIRSDSTVFLHPARLLLPPRLFDNVGNFRSSARKDILFSQLRERVRIGW